MMRLVRKIRNKLKQLWLKIITSRNADLCWLFRNRFLRMDANLAINTESRRIFHIDRYQFSVRKLTEIYSDSKELTILDAACGTGYGSSLLKNIRSSQVIGLDICPETVSYAQKKYSTENCLFKLCDLTQMKKIEDQTIDAVVSFETIEHLETPTIFLKNINRVLKKGGYLIISTPNKWGKTRDHKFDYDRQLLCEHLQQFFWIDSLYVQNSGSMDLWVNRGFPRRLIPMNSDNAEEAECFIAIARSDF